MNKIMHHITGKQMTLTTSPALRITGIIMLSWFYAVCSQIIIPLPYNLVPLSLQPAPLFLATFLFGWHAVTAYGLYLFQGALGLPFFSGMQGGLIRLLGPTGGYLIGFGLAMAFLATLRNTMPSSKIAATIKIFCALSLVFGCGLFQLSWFVAPEKLLAAGFYPFFIGDFIIKPVLVLFILSKTSLK